MYFFASSNSSGEKSINQLGKITDYAWFLAILWSLFIGASCYWEVISERKALNKIALSEANIAIERDLLYRRWGSSHGGVYVPITSNTPPNPYLSHIPERDISTPSGRQLTLVNPAYMIRQFYELAKDKAPSLGQGHLTSLKPLRPENKPDPWEEKTLKAFESGTKEFSEISLINGKPFMRLMKPFLVEKSCLKCHAIQGYKEGEIRGGLSVSIPLQPLLDASRTTINGVLVFNGVIWLLGLGVTGLGARQLSQAARAQKRIEDELHQQAVLLEEEIAERQMTQEFLQESELHLRIVADYSSNWEYWRLDDNSFLYISPSVIKLTGYSINEFMDDHKLIYRIIHPEDQELFQHHTHETDACGQILPIEMRIVTKSGDVRWIGHICQRVYNNDGIPWGWRASNQDITALKQLEHELFEQTEQLEDEVAERETAQGELEQLNHSLEERINKAVDELRHKDQTLIQQGRLAAMGEMINNIAHQWRQPLNNIGLIIQNVQFSFDSGTISSEELKSEINKAMDIIMHMSRTIDDFRNFFRVDKEKHGFFINNAVIRALEFVAASLEKRNIKVSTEADDDVTAIGHQNEYSQVLLNIISNAAETCVERNIENPHISIRITRENDRSVVYVRDNCGGIPDSVMPKIFDPYFTTRAPDKGTGIGLYMSKMIIEQNMAGSLTARSVEGGAEFRIEV
jgi:PAS domain S-box-containing protein